MEIHIHHSDEVYTDGGTLLQKQPTHPLKMQALSLVQEALRQSPGDYAFMLNFWQPLAVFKKIDEHVMLIAAEKASGDVKLIAYSPIDKFNTYQEGNAWAKKILKNPAVGMAIITSALGVVAAFERGPDGEVLLVACGDTIYPSTKLKSTHT